jgi:hypothetical protein
MKIILNRLGQHSHVIDGIIRIGIEPVKGFAAIADGFTLPYLYRLLA